MRISHIRPPRLRRPRATYANVASTLALMLALSMGGAYAHGKVGSWHIKNNAVKSRHLAFQAVGTTDMERRAVSKGKIVPRAVTSGKIARNVAGVAPAGISFQAIGTQFDLFNWFNRYGGKPTVTRNGSGDYTIRFPGLEGRLGRNAIVVANPLIQGAFVHQMHSASQDVVQIRTEIITQAGNRIQTDVPVDLVVVAVRR